MDRSRYRDCGAAWQSAQTGIRGMEPDDLAAGGHAVAFGLIAGEVGYRHIPIVLAAETGREHMVERGRAVVQCESAYGTVPALCLKQIATRLIPLLVPTMRFDRLRLLSRPPVSALHAFAAFILLLNLRHCRFVMSPR